MIQYLGWAGNLALIISLYAMHPRRRWPFVMSVVGEALWLVVSVDRRSADMIFLCVVFCVLAVRNFVKWGRQ
jgi:hypothetical protein